MPSKPTYSGIQNQVRNSANPPKVSSANPAWVNQAIASSGGRKR
jgi:hypothetical protein